MTSNEERKERDFHDLLLWKLSVYTKDGNLEILLTEASTQFYVPQKAKEYHFFTDKKKLFSVLLP